MAILIANTETKMSSGSSSFESGGRLVSATTTRIVGAKGDNREVYTGHFEYNNAGRMTDGTITGLKEYVGSVLQYSLTQLDVEVRDLIGFIRANDAPGFMRHMFRDADTLRGSSFSDKLFGYGGNDIVRGGGGGDRLLGGDGADSLNGQLGKDILTGGTGADSYVFNTQLGGGNVDTLQFFSSIDDTIKLDNIVFKKLATTGTLNADCFSASTNGNAVDSNDFILYDTNDGKLFYDVDGSGAKVKVQFGLVGINTHAALTAEDFSVI